MTLINDKFRPTHQPDTDPSTTLGMHQMPRYTLAILGPDGLVRFFVELKAGMPGAPGPARLAVLENGKIIASVNLEA